MSTFIMFGRYSATAIKDINPSRTKKAQEIVSKLGGKITAMYAIMGKHDLIFILELPGMDEALKASVALHRATGIAFSTSPAMSVETFDKLTAKL